MVLQRFIRGAFWLCPLAISVIIGRSQGGSVQSLLTISLWLSLQITAIWLMLVRWDKQWSIPATWEKGAIGCSILIALFGLYLGDDRVTATAMGIQCFVLARNHFERVSERTSSPRLNLLSFFPILILLMAVPNNLWAWVDEWHWSWLSSFAWLVLLNLDIPFLISNTGVELTHVVWSRQTILGDCFSANIHLAICMLWFGFTRRPVLLAVVYIAMALLWAFLTNFVRFVVSAWMITWIGTDCYQGWLFYGTGSAAMLGTFFLFMAADKLIGVVLAPLMSSETAEKSFNPLIDVWNRYFSISSNLPAGRRH